ncbi:hypothetical protein [Capnocytophaga sp. oral taxon 326]|jgi:hypothetical protein|uniref:hypothetical protein n=1 Tax=Capnocytophaga sp. oral taxon 326 TaxID=712212 RepID=UPI0002A32BCB|nr:hypothetical protein [Capnocytophaga sp. oral taxon 326]EKY17789.1 hypothetical protein HMPREF9073_01371 [Capnocytophaga sp. oral taxon 326 str. F0382]
MNESLVEWTLLREQNYLSECIGLGLKKKVFQQYSTKYGRIDFAHELNDGRIAITELETIIDSKSKLEYCQYQCLEYANIKFENTKSTIIVILIAEETPIKYKKELINFSKKNNFEFKTYSLDIVNKYYKQLIEEAVRNSGIPLVKPVANNFTHLSCLNRLILPFFELEKDILQREDFIEYFNLKEDKADSHFKVHKQMAEYFELIKDISTTKKLDKIELTNYGKRFRENINYEFITYKSYIKSDLKRIDLSLEQKRILLESLMNGNIGELKGKVNILYFLRFVHLTEGIYVPKGRKMDYEKISFTNSFLKTNYSEITLCNWLNFVCNHTVELGLIERINTNNNYDRAILTSLGSRVLGFIEMDLHLKRERSQIPLQI